MRTFGLPLILSVSGGKHAEAILDKFTTLDEVTDAVRKAGLEGCGLIFGKYTAILDRLTTLDEVTDAVRKAGLEGCGLIFGKYTAILDKFTTR